MGKEENDEAARWCRLEPGIGGFCPGRTMGGDGSHTLATSRDERGARTANLSATVYLPSDLSAFISLHYRSYCTSNMATRT